MASVVNQRSPSLQILGMLQRQDRLHSVRKNRVLGIQGSIKENFCLEEDLLEMASLINGFFFFLKDNLFPEEDRSSQNGLHKKEKRAK